MKKLSCFVLVVALVLAAGAAFALPNTEYEKLAPYTATDYDMFTIQGSFDVIGDNDVNHGSNKWIASADIRGLFLYGVTNDGTGVSGSFDVFAYATAPANTTVSNDWLAGQTANYGANSVVGTILSGDWIPLLVRTTKAATQTSPLTIPIYMVASNDEVFADTYFPLLSYDVTTEHNVPYAYACEVPCCGLNFYIDCCTPSDYSKQVKRHDLQVWFDDADRIAVYCCPGITLGFVSTSADLLLASRDIPVTLARLNADENMVRVRVATNFRYADSGANAFYQYSWYQRLAGGSYSGAKICEKGVYEFWPFKLDIGCQPTVSSDLIGRYWWKTSAGTVLDSLAVKDFFDDKDVIELADVRLGETLNLGVWYGGAEFGNCVCDSLPTCGTSADYVVPRINIQNLGTVKLDVAKCHEDPATYGICSADCGLCDTLPEGYSDVSSKTGQTTLGTTSYEKFYSGVYAAALGARGNYVDQAYRWGDFYYASNSSTKNDIITYDCPCYIYPAFTKTVQPRANSNFEFEMTDGAVTKITGRWNTSYNTHKLSTSSASLCGVDDCSFLFVYTPCGCEPTNVVNTLEKNLSTLIGKTYVNQSVTGATGLKLDGARVVVNPTTDAATGVADLKTAEGANLVWYNFFKVFEWDYVKNLARTSANYGILPVQLRFELSKDKISGDIDVTKAGWRDLVWEKYTLKARNADGGVSDIASDLANAKSVLDFRSFITCDKDEIKASGHVTNWTKLTVFLTAFVVDGPSPDGKAFHYYKNDTTNDYVLFVFDGKHDDIYQDIIYVAKPTGCTFNVTGETSFLKDTTTTLTATCLPTGCAGMSWVIESTDIATISGDANLATVVVLGKKVGTTKITATACTVSKDVTLTVTQIVTPTPTTVASSSSGGCNAGAFAPLALLLIAPVMFLLKK